MEIIPESSWEILSDELLNSKGTILFLGTTDSGKSTLVRYLIGKFVDTGVSTSLVDADVGQSAIGLPGTISMKAFRDRSDLQFYRFEKMSYIGVVNPAKALRAMIEGAEKMAREARKLAPVTLMDTTGLVSGDIGRALKIGKIRAVRPDHIVALERNGELEHILTLTEGIAIHRPHVSPLAKTRSPEYRARYRREKLVGYFSKRGLTEFLLNMRDADFVFKGRAVELREIDPKNLSYTVAGLNRGDDTRALGVVTDIADDSITMLSPLESLKGINRVALGEIEFDISLAREI